MKTMLRNATIWDCEALFINRNDALTRQGSHQAVPVDFESHRHWLLECLQDCSRQLFVFEVDGQPVGTSRLESQANCMKMFWSIYPAYRGRGYGKLLVEETLRKARGVVRAEVKNENVASKKIAEEVGFTLQNEVDDVCYYEVLIAENG